MQHQQTTDGYPWAEWFQATSVTLTKGVDFKCTIHGMIAQIRKRARHHGVRVSVEARGLQLVVTNRDRADKGGSSAETAETN